MTHCLKVFAEPGYVEGESLVYERRYAEGRAGVGRGFALMVSQGLRYRRIRRRRTPP